MWGIWQPWTLCGSGRQKTCKAIFYSKLLVWCLRNDFTYCVIPDLIRNPVFSTWIPAGVYPVEERGRNDIIRGSLKTAKLSVKSLSFKVSWSKRDQGVLWEDILRIGWSF
jgi:hypothetical protein